MDETSKQPNNRPAGLPALGPLRLIWNPAWDTDPALDVVPFRGEPAAVASPVTRADDHDPDDRHL